MTSEPAPFRRRAARRRAPAAGRRRSTSRRPRSRQASRSTTREPPASERRAADGACRACRRRPRRIPPQPAAGVNARRTRSRPQPRRRQACFRREAASQAAEASSDGRPRASPPSMRPGCRSAPAWPAAPSFSPRSGSPAWLPGVDTGVSSLDARLAGLEQQLRDVAARPLPAGVDTRALDDAGRPPRQARSGGRDTRPAATDPALANRIAAHRGRGQGAGRNGLHPRPPQRREPSPRPRGAPARRGDRRRRSPNWSAEVAARRRRSSAASSRRWPIAWPRSSAAERRSRPSSPKRRRLELATGRAARGRRRGAQEPRSSAAILSPPSSPR